MTELAVFPYEGAPVNYTKPTVELRVDSMLDTYNLFLKLRVLDNEGNELAWNKRSIKYNKKGDDYGFVRIPLTKDIEVGKDYHLILDVDIADTAGIHLPAARDIVFHGVDAGADKPGMQVAEDFEDASNFEISFPMGVSGNSIKASTERLFGSKSLQLDYDMTNENILVVNFNDPTAEGYVRGDTLGLHIWGDMSYNNVYVELNDPSTSPSISTLIPLGKIDFHGWRYVAVPLDDLYNGTFHVRSFHIARQQPLMGKTGTIRFDNLLKKESSGIDEARLANMQVRVAGDYIVVSADTYVQGVELLDIQGRAIKAAGNNCLNVADVPTGVYLVRVHINGRTATSKVKL